MAARPQRLVVTLFLCVGLLLAWSRPAWAGQARVPVPRRIISLVPAITEVLFAIGAGPQVIAVSSYDDDPPEVTKLPKVGALLDPDTERILALRPDLVIVYGSQTTLKEQLAKAGIAWFDYRHAGLGDVFPVFLALGARTGHEAEAARRVADMQARLNAVRARIAGRPHPRTLLVFGREPRTLRTLEASGGIGFLNDMLELAGGRNVFAEVKTQAVRVSTEMLITRAPEVVVELHYGSTMSQIDVAAEQAVWTRVGSVPAVKAGRIHLLFGDHLVVPGPRLVRAVEELARAIHPEAFR